MTETKVHPFIDHLQSLAQKQERGALAALRRGLGQPVGAAPEMFRYVEPFLPKQRSQAQESAYYLVASLFALHPVTGYIGNMGNHMARTRSESGEDALERRFTALLAAHPDDLPDFLRQSVSYLKSKEVPINWNQLFWDLLNWDHPDHKVQKQWASAFWGKSNTEHTSEESLSK